MAMTKCKECANQISTNADACPKCGAKQVRTSGCAKIALAFVVVVVLFWSIGEYNRNSTTKSLTPAAQAPLIQPPHPAASPPPAPPAPAALPSGLQWAYRKSEDPMAKGNTYFALVTSTNTVEFSFPYSGPQHATLTLRTHPRHGKDVILKIERGQFLCRSYEDCSILVRFDDQKAQSYSAVGAADNSSETIFIRNYSRFVASMKKGKSVRIAAQIYQQGSPVFEFNVTGFDASKYLAE